VFRHNAHLLGVPFTAIFIDDIPSNIEELKAIGCWTSDYKFFVGDNAVIVPQKVDEIVRAKIGTVYGLIYCDPNGLPDLNMLSVISKKLSKVDILIRMNVGAGKRQVNKMRVEDITGKLNKTLWLVRGPLSNDPAQWSFLFGTNYTEYKGWKKIGFHRLDSPEGRKIFDILNYTAEEKKAMLINKGVTCGEIESEQLDFS
jgi:hypothetical protein